MRQNISNARWKSISILLKKTRKIQRVPRRYYWWLVVKMVRTEHEPHIASYDSNKHICKPPNSIESNTNPGYTRKKTHFNDVFTHAIVNFRWQHLACPHHNIIILRLLQFWLQINFHFGAEIFDFKDYVQQKGRVKIGPIRGMKM